MICLSVLYMCDMLCLSVLYMCDILISSKYAWYVHPFCNVWYVYQFCICVICLSVLYMCDMFISSVYVWYVYQICLCFYDVSLDFETIFFLAVWYFFLFIMLWYKKQDMQTSKENDHCFILFCYIFYFGPDSFCHLFVIRPLEIFHISTFSSETIFTSCRWR